MPSPANPHEESRIVFTRVMLSGAILTLAMQSLRYPSSPPPSGDPAGRRDRGAAEAKAAHHSNRWPEGVASSAADAGLTLLGGNAVDRT